ncbi:von Willebrand factor type A domain-containing protein [Stigmatella aurantiaca]|uniref:von Willebrand factor type A domain-containing protein n=1 Tax=Stigmatella aurantiaca TaxID=41 RepID=A0A1H7VBJ0_STIAU|nr:vWA domain-containing protein [Stigmatella aurantiaca]SEM06400.1 von Willebrand factor type A domain-containing protein [Stigmatella aurantiaca]
MSLKFLVRPFLAAALATTVFSAPRALAEEAPPAAQKAAAPQIEVVFVLDTTGSMGSLLEGAKQKIFSIASRIATGKPTPRLKVGVVAYRDVGDEYVTKRFDLSEDLDTVFTHLRQLRADGGGDSPEHVGRGLGEAVSKMSWSSGRETMKVIFLVGDAPPASREQAWNFQQWSKAAKERRIVVNTVRCGDDAATEKAWKAVAKLTDGTFDSIDSSGGMLAVATPYDAELAEVNGKIAAKTLYTGTAVVQAENRDRAAQMAALPAESAAERISYMKKARGKSALGAGAVSSAPVAVGGAVDLAEKPEMLASVKEAELPAPLQGLSKQEQAAKVKTLVAERKVLEERAAKLAAERDTWRQKNVAETEASFDDNVMKSVRKQASSYGVAY